MVSGLVPSPVVRGFDPRSCQTKNYEIGICCFSAKKLMNTSKDWSCRNYFNMLEWRNMST